MFKRGELVGKLEVPGGDNSHIKKLIVFGSWIVGCGSNRLEIWRSSTYEHYTTITPSGWKYAAGSVLTGDVCSMPTFLNKIFVGKRDGGVDIWNLNTGKLIYTIFPPTPIAGAVTALEPSPALSVLAIARSNGSITLHNVRTDKPVLVLGAQSSQTYEVSSISFRTDGLGAGDNGNKEGVMATASSSSGDVTLWDLNNGGRVRGVLRGAHNSFSLSGTRDGINRVEFLAGQDVMITNGSDNALKSWIFDANSLSPTPRILHSRSGHASPVTRLNFVPPNSDGAETSGKWLMSASRDQSLWAWSLRRDGQSTELSQGNIRSKAKKLGFLGKSLESEPLTDMDDLKAPEITSIACSMNRDGGMGASAGGGSVWTNTASKRGPNNASETLATGWESVVTAHRGDQYARTWFWGRKKAGRWAFPSGDSTEVTAVAMSHCGTFGTYILKLLVPYCGGLEPWQGISSGIRNVVYLHLEGI